MKKHIILSIALISIFLSCKKSWLDIVPQGTQIAVTTEDYNKLMNDPLFFFHSYAGGLAEPLLMGDEVAAEGPFFTNQGDRDYRERFFQWRDSIYPSRDVPSYTLRTHLTQVYELNKVINEVMKSTGGTDELKKAIRADALANRGWSLFLMANLYCKPYVASTAATDQGFPIITATDVTATRFERGTVQQTYDFLIKDLTDALTDIPVKQASVSRMSKPAVEGILGKVYLFMGKYNEALPLLKSSLAGVIANGQTSLYNYNQTLTTGGSFLPITPTGGPSNSPALIATDVKESVVYKAFYSGSFLGNYTGNTGIVLAPAAQALYGASDLRLLLYTNRNDDNSPNAGGRIRKYGRYSRYCLQLSELYLLLAECKARTNDLGGAVADVETLRKNRMPLADAPVPGAIAGNQTALIKFIIDERIREFAAEGYRWLDMRRLSTDPLFSGMTFTHTVYNTGSPNTVYTLNLPNRLVLQLPRNITDANPNMPNNP